MLVIVLLLMLFLMLLNSACVGVVACVVVAINVAHFANSNDDVFAS